MLFANFMRRSGAQFMRDARTRPHSHWHFALIGYPVSLQRPEDASQFFFRQCDSGLDGCRCHSDRVDARKVVEVDCPMSAARRTIDEANPADSTPRWPRNSRDGVRGHCRARPHTSAKPTLVPLTFEWCHPPQRQAQSTRVANDPTRTSNKHGGFIDWCARSSITKRAPSQASALQAIGTKCSPLSAVIGFDSRPTSSERG